MSITLNLQMYLLRLLHANDVALWLTMSEIKYLSNYWMDCHEMLCRIDINGPQRMNGTRLDFWVLKGPKKIISKTQNQCLFQKISAQLLKIIHRPRCELFHAGTTFCQVEGKCSGRFYQGKKIVSALNCS